MADDVSISYADIIENLRSDLSDAAYRATIAEVTRDAWKTRAGQLQAQIDTTPTQEASA